MNKYVKTFEQYILEEYDSNRFDTYSGPNVVSGLADRIGKNLSAGSDGIIASAKAGGEFGGNNPEPTSTGEQKRKWKYQRTPKKKASQKRLSALQKLKALDKVSK